MSQRRDMGQPENRNAEILRCAQDDDTSVGRTSLFAFRGRGTPMAILPGVVWSGDVVEIEVEGGGLEFEEEVEIELVVAGAGVVFAGEALDGGDVIPKSKHLEVGDVVLFTGEAPGAAIADGGTILGKGDGAHEVEVSLTFCNGNSAVPDAGDHSVHSSMKTLIG